MADDEARKQVQVLHESPLPFLAASYAIENAPPLGSRMALLDDSFLTSFGLEASTSFDNFHVSTRYMSPDCFTEDGLEQWLQTFESEDTAYVKPAALAKEKEEDEEIHLVRELSPIPTSFYYTIDTNPNLRACNFNPTVRVSLQYSRLWFVTQLQSTDPDCAMTELTAFVAKDCGKCMLREHCL